MKTIYKFSFFKELKLINNKKLYLFIYLFLLFSFNSFSQQVIGAFPTMDGGFEAQTTIVTQSSIATNTVSTVWATACTSGVLKNTGGRSGPKYATITLTSTGTASTYGSGGHKRTTSPTTALSAMTNTSYQVQYFYRTSGASVLTGITRGGASDDGTAGSQYGTAATVSSSTWTKYTGTAVVTQATPITYGVGIIDMYPTAASNTIIYDYDDFVVYPGTVADVTAPSSPGAFTVTSTSLTSNTVSWGAASGGVDGGGYVVVRYETSPGNGADPNQNGIYALGNTINNGGATGTVAYIGTGLSFTDSNLTAGTNYNYKIYTVDKAFNYSASALQSSTITGATTTNSFTTTYGTASAVQTFTIGGSSLTANIIATAPTGFEVSADGTTYGPTATFVQTNGNASGSLRIRLKATATVFGVYNSKDIVLTSGAISVNITTPSTGNSVTAKALSISGLSVSNKVYDGVLTASFNGTATYSGLENGESFSVTGTPSANFVTSSVGTNKSVIFTGFTAPNTNYSISQPNLTANITAQTLTITANNQANNYGTVAYLGTTAFTSTGLVNSETIGSVLLSSTGAAATSAVGTYDIVPSGASGGTFNSANYIITYVNGTLTVNAVVAGSPTITAVTAGDTTLSIAFTNPTFTGGAAISNYQYSLNGTNYTTLSPAQTTSPIVVTGLTNNTTYSVTVAAINSAGIGTISNVVTATPLSASTPLINVSGALIALTTIYGSPSTTTSFTASGSSLTNNIVITAPEGFEISQTSASSGFSFSQSLVPSNGVISDKTIFIRLAPSANVGSYSGYITLSSTGATTATVLTVLSSVNPAPLTITGLAASNKVYDKTTAVTITGTPTYNGLVNGEVWPVSGAVSYAFETATAGNGKAIVRTGSYDAPSSNYSISQPSFTASISPINLTLTNVAASNKIYDSTTDASISASVSGVLSGDTVNFNITGNFASAAIGTGIAVTSSAILTGADASNYTFDQLTGLTADITARTLSISGISIANKTYNGSTNATITGTAILNGAVVSDGIQLITSGATASFSDKNIGTNKAVTISGYTISGGAASNYAFTEPSGFTASITAAPLTITGISISNKIYDATTAATIVGTPILNGVVGSEDVTLVTSGASATFASAAVGTNINITVYGYSVTGTDIANYTFTEPTGLKATITAIPKYYFVPTSGSSIDATPGQWWSNANGTGFNPSNFTGAGVTYQINVNATTSAAFAVSGTGSKIVVGEDTYTPTLTIASGFAITGTVDLGANTTLVCEATTLPTFGTLAASSTVNVKANNTFSPPATPVSFGNLIVSNAATLSLTASASRTINFEGNFDVSGGVLNSAGSTSTIILNFNGTSNTIKSSAASTFDKINTINIRSGAYYTLLSDLKCNSGTTVRIFSLGGTLDVSGYTLDVAVNTYTLGAAGILIQNATSTVRTSNTSSTPLPAGSTWNGTVEYYSTSAQTIVTGNYNNLTISGASTKTVTAGVINVAKNLTINSGATLTGATNNPTLNLGGNFTNSGTFTQGNGTLSLNGTNTQTVTNSGTFTNVTVNNAAGLVTATNLTVNGALTLTSGVITTNSFAVKANGDVIRTSGHIAGNLTKPVSTTTSTITYEIGGANLYRPINFTFNGITTAGTLTASVSQSAGTHPNFGTSNISYEKRLDRYYTVSNSGVGFTTCDAVFNFDASDVINGANTSSFIAKRFASSAWANETTGNLTGSSTQVIGLTSFGDFAFGEVRSTPTLVASSPITFADQCINTSGVQTFTLAGQNLTTDPITVGPLTGFSFSTNGTSFMDSLSIQSGTTLASTPIYVMFTPTTNTSYAGNISVVGAGSNSVSVTITSANGIITPLNSTTGASSAVSANAATIAGSFIVSCNTLTEYGIEYSTTSNFANGTGIHVISISGPSYTVALSGLNSNTTYYYKSYVKNGTNTVYGSQSSFHTTNIIAPLATAGTNIASTSFQANWNPVAGATSYSLDVSLYNFFNGIVESFENNTLTNFFTTTGGGNFSGNSGTGDRPASSPLASSGTTSFGVSNSSASIVSSNINTTALTNPQLSFNLASFSIGSTANGADATDIVTVEVSPDGGANYYSTVRVLGNSNAYWPFTATGVATTAYDGNDTSVDFQPSAGGNRTSDGYSTVTVTGLPSTTNLKVRITLLNNSASERWVVDNLRILGTQESFIPGYNNLSVSGTTQLVTGLTSSTDYYYRVRANDSNSTSLNSNTVLVTTTIDPSIADYRSLTSGDYSSISTWEYNNGSSWIAAVQVPTADNNVTIVSGHTVSLTDNISFNSGKTINVNGILNAAGKVISGAGNFLLNSGSTIKLGDNYSLTTAVTTTSKTFSSVANYVYNGTVAQSTGSLPGTVTGNVTIDNSAGVILTANKTTNTPGTFTVTSNGNLLFGNGTGTSTYYLAGTGNFIAATGCTLVITNSNGITSDGTTGSIRFTGTRSFAPGINYNFTKFDALSTSNMGSSFGTEITSINNLVVNNPNNVIVPTNISVNGVLNFITGNILSGTNTITIAPTGSVVRTGNGYVVGNLAKTISTSTTAISYEIGDPSSYSPINLAFNGVSTAGILTANVSQTVGAHPQIASTTIAPSRIVNHYYTLSSDSSLSFTSYNAAFNFVSSNILNNANPYNFIIGKYDGTTWSYPSLGTVNNFSTQATGLSSFGQFTIGEIKASVDLKLNIEGYYNAITNSMVPVKANQFVGSSTFDVDDFTLELRAADGTLVDTATVALKTNGTAGTRFPNSAPGSYYLVIKYKNAIETWSATPQLVGLTPLTYDFTNAASKAYGNNMKQVSPGVFAIYSGDINQDSNVDNLDYSAWEEDANNLMSGYFATDLNGDGNVDNLDYSIWETNSNNFVYSITPF